MSTQTRDWGAPLWRILHSMAENIGFQTVPMLATDEANEMIFVLKFTEDIMPCLLCRNHYRMWKKKHPVDGFAAYKGEILRLMVREWLYNLHEEINHDRGVVSNLRLEDLTELYKNVSIGDEWNTYLQKIKKSSEMGLMKPGALANFNRHLVILRKLTGKI